MNIPPKTLKMRIALTGSASPADTDSKQSASPAKLSGGSGIYTKATRSSTPSVRSSSDLADMADVSADSLPVLQAFQEFIESERRHARRQVAIVTSFFLMLFLLVAGAGAFFGYVYFTQMNTEIAILRSELASAGTSVRKDTAEMISSLAKRTESISDNIIGSDELIRKASLQISNTFSNAISSRQAELDQIRRTLKAIQEENQDLKDKLSSIAAAGPAAATGMSMADSGIKPAPSEDAADTKPVNSIPALPGKRPAMLKPIEIAILAPNAKEPVKWRIPISE